ncbi:MAG: Ku protein [Acidimicrobiales bacterium]
MPRPIWSGSISFGLVNVPVKLFTAVSQKDVRFNQLHSKDNARIKQKRVSAVTGEEIPYDEIVKGYEVAPDQYVVLEPNELESLDPKATHTIEIEEFVHLDQIDPLYFDKPYYLVPDQRAGKPYKLLAEALEETDKVAIAKFVMRTKEYLAAIRVKNGVLIIEIMNYADEIVDADDLEGLPGDDIELTEKEVKMAKQLIDSLTADDFEPEKYEDTYREKVMELIEAKAAGEVFTAPATEAEPAKVENLLAALEASVNAAREARGNKPEDDKQNDGAE